MALCFLSLPLAAAACAFHRGQGWKEFGYARLSDHARERLDRSARWVRDLAALSEAAERLPGLAAALTGEDGGRPIGLVSASHIGKVAEPDSLGVWLSMARTHSVRDLKAWTSRAAAAGTHWPEAADDPAAENLPVTGDSHQRICLPVPAAAREAFAETLDLYRAVEGHTASVGEFVESLIAEAGSGTLAGRVHLEAADRETRGALQGEKVLQKARRHGNANSQHPDDETCALQKSGTTPNENADARADASPNRTINADSRHLPPTPQRRFDTRAHADSQAEEANLRAHARRWLKGVLGETPGDYNDALSRPPSDAETLHTSGAAAASGLSCAVTADARMRRLISLNDEIERQLAEVVTEMADKAAWLGLGYHGLEDYARRGLGWSRSTLYSRAQLVRHLRRLPVVQQAYRQGRIGRVATQTIARLLSQGSHAGATSLRVPDAVQRAWVERAAAATIKRLHDETRAVARLMVMGTDQQEPLDDPAWHGSLHRQVGSARERVQTLSRLALTTPGPLLPLRLYLEGETAADLFRVLAVARRDPALVQTFSPQSDAVPVWVALLALLQEFIETWDVDVSGRRPSAQRIYNRDGWRCMAPGCTSRRNLEVHHVMYRSRGGDDRPENLACLCRFHHQMGEHGLLASVRGKAPLGLTWWLGRDGRGGRYRNEIRLTE